MSAAAARRHQAAPCRLSLLPAPDTCRSGRSGRTTSLEIPFVGPGLSCPASRDDLKVVPCEVKPREGTKRFLRSSAGSAVASPSHVPLKLELPIQGWQFLGRPD